MNYKPSFVRNSILFCSSESWSLIIFFFPWKRSEKMRGKSLSAGLWCFGAQQRSVSMIGLSSCIFRTVTMKDEVTCISLCWAIFVRIFFLKSTFLNFTVRFQRKYIFKKSSGSIQGLVSVISHVWRGGFFVISQRWAQAHRAGGTNKH